MKPGVSAATTGVLPSWRARSATLSATAGAVIGPAITSTSAMSGTGLKKCMPRTRSGRAVAAAMRATDSELVFVARIVVVAGDGVEAAERVALELELLGDRLDHQVGDGQRLQAGGRADARERVGRILRRKLLLLDLARQEAADPLLRALGGAVDRVVDSSTSSPASAATCAMPAPIVPAPRTPMVVISFIGRLNRGSRFSPKAATPSAWSSVRPASSCSAASAARLSASEASSAALTSRLVRPIPRVGPSASRRASSPGRFGERVGRHDRGDEPGVVRRRRRRAARSPSRISKRPMTAERANQRSRQARVGHKADAVEGRHEARILGRDDQVGGERQADAGAGGDAVDRCDRPASAAHGWPR